VAFLKNLFGSKKGKPVVQDLPGHEELQTKEEQAATRGRMEAEMDRSREQRAANPPQDKP
jgi:hypothetical protein